MCWMFGCIKPVCESFRFAVVRCCATLFAVALAGLLRCVRCSLRCCTPFISSPVCSLCSYATIAGGEENRVAHDYASVLGGYDNTVRGKVRAYVRWRGSAAA